jgi:hypothetical protein
MNLAGVNFRITSRRRFGAVCRTRARNSPTVEARDTRSTWMSMRPVVVGGALLLLLLAAGTLLWDDVPEPATHEPVHVVRAVGQAAAPVTGAASAALRPAPPAAAASAASAPTAAAPVDPFKAFLERANGQPPAAAATNAGAPSPDPFRAAIEAQRRADPVPLVSPFGAKP